LLPFQFDSSMNALKRGGPGDFTSPSVMMQEPRLSAERHSAQWHSA